MESIEVTGLVMIGSDFSSEYEVLTSIDILTVQVQVIWYTQTVNEHCPTTLAACLVCSGT